MNKKVVFVHTGGHYVHRGFAKKVTQNFIDITKEKVPGNYDLYLVEGGYLKVALLRMFGKINRKGKIIGIFADPRLYFMKVNRYLDIKEGKVRAYPFVKKLLSKFLLKMVDAGVCVSRFEEDLLKYFCPRIKSIVVYPFFRPERYLPLREIVPNLKTKNILFIGNQDFYYKGLDLLVEAFRRVKEKVVNANLYVLGEIPIKDSWKFEGVHFEGKTDPGPYWKKCSLYVHPGRGEAFGVSVIEAMLAGVPPMVSDCTGAKEFVEKVSGDLIFQTNVDEIKSKIISYFETSIKEKKRLSRMCKETPKELTEEKQTQKFKEEFDVLIKHV